MGKKLIRLMTLARHIPCRPYKQSASQLKVKLEEEGIYVSMRTIQRDLDEMSSMGLFNLTSDDRNRPHGWYFEHRGLNDLTNMMPLSLAVALQTWHIQANHLLPASILAELNPFIDKAKLIIHGSQSVVAERWFESVYHATPLIVDRHSHLIHDALWQGCKFNADVQRVVKGHTVWLCYERINPLGALRLVGGQYLLCTLPELDPKVYCIAFDHIRNITLTHSSVTKPSGFTIQKWLGEQGNSSQHHVVSHAEG